MTSPAFAQPLHLRCSCLRPNIREVFGVRCVRPFRVRPVKRASRLIRFSAIQVNAVSDGYDGEVREDELEKSYSVGVTIVSGYDAELRRRVIENIVSECTGKRVVVVTASGIASTREFDGDDVNVSLDNQSGDIETQISKRGKSSATDNLEGWLSCSSYDEMAEVVAKLATSREYDYIVAEGASSALFGPQQIATLLHAKGGASLRVDTLVSVLDGCSVLDDLGRGSGQSNASKEETSNGVEPPSQDQSTSRPMLIVSLVENANVIVLNHEEDNVQNQRLESVSSLLSVLNRKASIFPSKSCSVAVDEVVNTNLYNAEELELSASWKLMLMADRSGQANSPRAVPKSLKDSTFVYRARRPFHPARLFEQLRVVQTFSGVIRSTGKIWLATRMLAPLEWNQAGESATLQLGDRFFAALPETDWPSDEDKRKAIMEKWDNQFGDRETELVFVGMGIDKERLQGLLDGCLLQDEEMVFTNLWENFEDPFTVWVPLIEDPFLDEAETEEESSENMVSENVAEVSNERVDLETTVDTRVSEASENEANSEGVVEDLPEDLVERASLLDALNVASSDDSGRLPHPADDGIFDEDNVVISSGKGTVADGILKKIPRTGLPVTILTGFLGSGKTTILNYILKAQHGFRIAVLVNEFGDIDIDSQLVEGGAMSTDEVMELSNGCICCNINDSFLAAVQNILERKERFDYVIIETTGLADPGPILNSLVDSELTEQIRIDGVLTVVDADSIAASDYQDSQVAQSQILNADTVLLSKTDIASEESVEKAVDIVKSVRPAARILRTQRGRIPLKLILDVGIRVAGGVQDNSKSSDKDTKSEHQHDQDHEHNHEHEHSHDDDSHDHDHDHGFDIEGFTTTSFMSDAPLDPQKFMKFMEKLPNEVFRAKGLLHFYGFPQRIVFQLSGRRYSFEEDEWPEDVAPGNQLVIIGRDLDIDELQDNLEESHVEEDEN